MPQPGQPPPPTLSTSPVSGQGQPADRSYAGLQYQRFQGEAGARGQALGQGLRTVFSAPVQSPFRQGPRALSAAQFSGGGAGARSVQEEE